MGDTPTPTSGFINIYTKSAGVKLLVWIPNKVVIFFFHTTVCGSCAKTEELSSIFSLQARALVQPTVVHGPNINLTFNLCKWRSTHYWKLHYYWHCPLGGCNTIYMVVSLSNTSFTNNKILPTVQRSAVKPQYINQSHTVWQSLPINCEHTQQQKSDSNECR